MNPNLKEKTTEQLKAFAYDLQVVIQQYNQTLQVVSQEIGERARLEQEAKSAQLAKKVADVPVMEVVPENEKGQE